MHELDWNPQDSRVGGSGTSVLVYNPGDTMSAVPRVVKSEVFNLLLLHR